MNGNKTAELVEIAVAKVNSERRTCMLCSHITAQLWQNTSMDEDRGFFLDISFAMSLYCILVRTVSGSLSDITTHRARLLA